MSTLIWHDAKKHQPPDSDSITQRILVQYHYEDKAWRKIYSVTTYLPKNATSEETSRWVIQIGNPDVIIDWWAMFNEPETK